MTSDLGPRVAVDRGRCIGSGMCRSLAPEVFALDGDGKAVVLDAESTDELLSAAVDARECCPVEAITVQE